MPVLHPAHYPFPSPRFRAMMCSSSSTPPMTEPFNLHDDYENFANYLGVDYEDYVNLELGVDDEVIELDYSTVF